MRRLISMAGLRVAVEAGDEARWAALDALFGPCPGATTGPAAIDVRFEPQAPAAPDRPPDVDFGDVVLWYTDDGVVTGHESGIVVVRRVGTVLAGGPAGPGSARALRRSVQHVLCDAMAEHDRFALHGAVIVGDGQAAVVLGDTGAGKSTLAIAALGSGWSVATDDIGWVRATPGSITVAGFPKPLHAPPDTLAGVPGHPDGAAADPLPDDPRRRLAVRGRILADDVARPIRGVVVVRHGVADAVVLPMGERGELVGMLVRSFPLQGSPARVRQFFPIAARIGRLPAVVLEHDADPQQRVERAAACFAEAWERFGSSG